MKKFAMFEMLTVSDYLSVLAVYGFDARSNEK